MKKKMKRKRRKEKEIRKIYGRSFKCSFEIWFSARYFSTIEATKELWLPVETTTVNPLYFNLLHIDCYRVQGWGGCRWCAWLKKWWKVTRAKSVLVFLLFSVEWVIDTVLEFHALVMSRYSCMYIFIHINCVLIFYFNYFQHTSEVYLVSDALLELFLS